MGVQVPGTVSMATSLIPPSPWGILPTPQAWHRPPRKGSKPRSWQGDRGCWAPVAGRVLLCVLCLMPAGSRGAEDLGWGNPAPSIPVNNVQDSLYVGDVTQTVAVRWHLPGAHLHDARWPSSDASSYNSLCPLWYPALWAALILKLGQQPPSQVAHCSHNVGGRSNFKLAHQCSPKRGIERRDGQKGGGPYQQLNPDNLTLVCVVPCGHRRRSVRAMACQAVHDTQ